MARPSTRRTRPLTRARPPPRSSRRRVMTSKVRHAPLLDVPAQQGRDRHRPPACRCCAAAGTSTAGAPPAAAPARRCAGGWALHTSGRRGAGIAAAGCRCSRWPRRRCCAQLISACAQAVAHLLLLLVEHLLRHFLPDEPQVADHGNHAQADRFAGRQEQRPVVAVVVLPGEEFLGRRVGQVAGGEDVRNGSPGLARRRAGSWPGASR